MPDSPCDPKSESPPKPSDLHPGRILAIDLGTKRVGVAITDELQLTIRPLPVLRRSNWKKLTFELRKLCQQFDVKTVVMGLPLKLDGQEGDAAFETRRAAQNLQLTLGLPVVLQDERFTSVDAETRLRDEGLSGKSLTGHLDSEAAALILGDFISKIRRDPNCRAVNN